MENAILGPKQTLECLECLSVCYPPYPPLVLQTLVGGLVLECLHIVTLDTRRHSDTCHE